MGHAKRIRKQRMKARRRRRKVQVVARSLAGTPFENFLSGFLASLVFRAARRSVDDEHLDAEDLQESFVVGLRTSYYAERLRAFNEKLAQGGQDDTENSR